MKAAKSGDANAAKILVNCTSDTCADSDAYSSTPLIYAAKYGHLDVVRVLLDGGAEVDRADSIRSTALHHAAFRGHLEVCRELLERGATVDPVNSWKDTPLHCAARGGHLSVVKLLVERGADVSLQNYWGETVSYDARSVDKQDVTEQLDGVSGG
jgi:ankyrin repeat protein